MRHHSYQRDLTIDFYKKCKQDVVLMQLGCLTRETAFTEDMEDEIFSNDDSIYLLKTHNFYKQIRE